MPTFEKIYSWNRGNDHRLKLSAISAPRHSMSKLFFLIFRLLIPTNVYTRIGMCNTADIFLCILINHKLNMMTRISEMCTRRFLCDLLLRLISLCLSFKKLKHWHENDLFSQYILHISSCVFICTSRKSYINNFYPRKNGKSAKIV